MSGHGHVNPNPDGSKARCGGPAICPVCARELGAKQAAIAAKLTTRPPADILVPPEAVTVAHDILWGGQMSEALVRRALEVAAPYIRASDLIGEPPQADGSPDVHVDWHMTPAEWAELREALLRNPDGPYIARLIAEGKLGA